MNRSIARVVTIPLACAAAATAGLVQPPATTPSQPPAPADAVTDDAWRADESTLLTRHIQITSRDKFVKAGEQYFNADATWIIFQAIPVPQPGQEPAPFYSMYIARLTRDAQARVTGTEEPVQISPPMSANTCGWFHPTQPARVMYGSTMGEPTDKQKSGFQVGSRRYQWMFPAEMEIVVQTPMAIVKSLTPELQAQCGSDFLAQPLFSREGYDAECSWDPTGRFVLYANVDPAKISPSGRGDADIYIYDSIARKHHPIVVAPGYDGGPFFSPDGKSICYRSDRKGDDLLQLFIADLKFEKGPDGVMIPVGLEREYQITENGAVNWAPYWHPSGNYLVYGSSEVGHSNYEVFAVEVDRSKLADGKAAELRRRRVTFAPGADVLPTFSNDGTLMMWTSQRGPKAEGEERSSSQIWIAEVAAEPFNKEWRE
jgi:TolB protein